jgi:hypothetical protein
MVATMAKGIGWQVRKTLGFESEGQYGRFKQVADLRGQSVAQFLSWLAEGYLEHVGFESSEGNECEEVELNKVRQVVVHLEGEALLIAKEQSRILGLSMGKYLVRTMLESVRKVRPRDRSNRQKELALIVQIQAAIVVEKNSEKALSLLREMQQELI